MRVLWLCNVVLPEIATILGFKKQNYGGWLIGAWNELKRQAKLELGICVPIRNPERLRDGVNNEYSYYSFLVYSAEIGSDFAYQQSRFIEIINDFKPDVIHIWGTEYEHSYSMINACKQLGISKRILVNIQGLLTYCEKVYEYGISEDEAVRTINTDSIRIGKKAFNDRSILERNSLKNVYHVCGRTDWDFACVREINPNVKYYHCGEVLRDCFYKSRKWSLNDCRRHNIFLSQASYPIKGLHLVLNELKRLAERYDDLIIKIAGVDISNNKTAYSNFVMQEIFELKLEPNIVFLGNLTEEEMIDEYLKCNVFLSPSVIENSSNSVCEAMMLGVPVVASFVGGMASVIEHGKSGYMYPLTEPELMSFYIEKIFDGDYDLKELSKKEILSAEKYNSKKDFLNTLLTIYSDICE